MKRFKTRSLCAAIFAGLLAVSAHAPVLAAKAAPMSRVIVVYKAGMLAKMKAEIASRGGSVVTDLSEVNALSAKVPAKAVALLKKSGLVSYVEDDVMHYARGDVPSTGSPYALGQTVPYGIPMVQADQLPDTNAANRTLCIVDSGIDAAHEDHVGNKLSGVDLTGSGIGDWNTDEASHGTHVAGTIAAVNQANVGVVGVLPNKQINLYIAKVFDASGSAPSSTIIKAMLQCRKAGANVISMSLGSPSASKLEGTVAKLLGKLNVLMVAAAGNAGTSDIEYPGGFDEVMAVAAIDESKTRASFSQFNATVEIAGPGVSTLSTVPTNSGQDSSLSVAGNGYEAIAMTGSPNGSSNAPLADFGLGDTPVAGSMAGKTCLISRGNIAFADKVLNCQNSGGLAAVIYNNVDGPLNGTLGTTVTTIPSVGISQADGGTLLGLVGVAAELSLTPSSYALFNGTSMATPHVSAVAALVWSYFPSCKAAEIRASLTKSAMDLGPVGRDDEYGYGLVQAKAAYDRINSLGCGN